MIRSLFAILLGITGLLPLAAHTATKTEVSPSVSISDPSKHAQAPQTTVPKPLAASRSTPEKPATGIPAAVPHKLEKADLEAFFDGILPLQLERSDVAGAAVLVTKGGQTLLEKGYGYADLAKKKPVDPQTTIFRLASISKLFTWVSVMQLEEQGKLSIDTDVNQYLDFRIAPAFGKPITLRNLMTHTGGFEEVLRNLIVTDPKQSSPLRDHLIQNQPRHLFPPGEVAAYSNYGVGLAGYIVQRLSGKAYETYVAEHIFGPLRMTHSSFTQPLPQAMSSLVSNGYGTSTEKRPIGFEIVNTAPAGGVSSTAADMGRFAEALLNSGELDGKRILNSETLQAMWTRQFAASDQLPAMCMGFYQVWRNGLHFIGHEGDLIAFHSMFLLEPQQKLALFISYNSVGSASKARDEVLRAFADRYYPDKAETPFQQPSPGDLNAMTGTYQSTRRSDSTKMKLRELFSEAHATVDDKNGLLRVDDFKDMLGHVQRYKLIGKDLWQEEEGQDRLFGIRDSQGKVVRLAFDFPGTQLERVRWYENDHLIFSLLGASLAILAAVVLATLFRAGRRLLFRGRPQSQLQPATPWLPFGARIATFVWIALIIFVGAFSTAALDPDSLPPTNADEKYFVLFNLLACLAIFFSLFSFWAAAKVLHQKETRLMSRLKFLLVALSCAFLSWFSIHWNLIGAAHRY